MANEKVLWRYNKVTGLWNYARTVTTETESQWLEVFRKHEPGEYFKVAKYRPKNLI